MRYSQTERDLTWMVINKIKYKYKLKQLFSIFYLMKSINEDDKFLQINYYYNKLLEARRTYQMNAKLVINISMKNLNKYLVWD